MRILISPAKSLDFTPQTIISKHTEAAYLGDSAFLIEQLRQLSASQIADLMDISPNLSELNYQRYKDWKLPFSTKNAKQAILAFNGDVYDGLAAKTFEKQDFTFAQTHLRILSGLYGLLKPLDLIQPYRLEMGTSLQTSKGKDLYEFWGHRITEALNTDFENEKNPVLINLASNEYFKVIRAKELKARILNISFKEYKNGEYKIVSFFAKKARGLMAAYIIRNRIKDIEKIKAFDSEGYGYHARLSKENEWIFVRG
jgi:uncharacterized protein